MPKEPAPPPPPPDPVLEAELERAIAPYKDLLSPEALAEMRDYLEDALLTHPVGMRLLAAVRPPPIVAESDDYERAGDGTLKKKPEAPGKKKAKKGGA